MTNCSSRKSLDARGSSSSEGSDDADSTGPGAGESALLEPRLQATRPPAMHQVLLLNDDYTPMEFVVLVLQEFFYKDRETATQIMLKIHLEGKGVCGVYTPDVAASKVAMVNRASRHAGHPLQCVSEPINAN